MRRHTFAKRRDLLGKLVARFGDEPVLPEAEHVARGVEQACGLIGTQAACQLQRRQPRREQDLVRVRVTDSGEQVRVGQRTLEGVVLAAQLPIEVLQRQGKHVGAARIVGCERIRAADDVERRLSLRTRFGEEESAVRKVEGGQPHLAGHLRSRLSPAKAARNHQVDDQKVVLIQLEDDSLPQTLQACHTATRALVQARLDRSHQKRARQPDAGQRLADHARSQRV